MYRRGILSSPRVAAMLASLILAGGSATPLLSQQYIDLSQLGTTHPGFQINGVSRQDYFGQCVSGAGDLNQDGLSDVVGGAIYADPGGDLSAGQSFAVFGKSSGAPVDLSALGTGGFRIDGINAFDFSGFSVSGVGDVNGDGKDDLVVGAYAAAPGGMMKAGESFVVFGKGEGATVDLANLGTDGFWIIGREPLDASGISVAGAGDVNGDGLADLIVGATSFDSAYYDNRGDAFVVFGKKDNSVVNLASPGTQGFLIDGVVDNYNFGISVSGAGDFNGDGLADLVIGDDQVDGHDPSPGRAFVLFGKANSDPIYVDYLYLVSVGVSIAGINSQDALGSCVSGAGDVNGDGLADIIIGAPTADPDGKAGAGQAFVVFGARDQVIIELASLGTGGFRIDGFNTNDDTGRSVSGAGDVNGDGLADLIIGASRGDPSGKSSAGESYVIYGKKDSTSVDLGNLGSTGFRIDGSGAGDYSGRSVSGAGDVNGDGLADLVVGAWGADVGVASDAGAAYVVFSPSTAPLSATYLSYATGGNAPRTAIGIVGDGSNDGTPDSRCWIDFADGEAISLQTVALTRSTDTLSNLPVLPVAPVSWGVSTDRPDWHHAAVTFRYTDAEISGMEESVLRLYRAASPAGPWGPLRTEVNAATNTARAQVSQFGYFVLLEDSSPFPDPGGWMLE